MYKVVKYGNVLENTQVVYTGSLRACRYKLSMIKNEYGIAKNILKQWKMRTKTLGGS